ncbi:MAG: formylglycine-generating enzyme family protein [Opitutales bacterium]
MISWVKIPAGTLVLDPDRPDRFRLPNDPIALTLEKALWVSQSPISEKQWATFETSDLDSDLPKVDVNYADAVRFAESAKGPESQTCRLLTSEEWEYACRAGTKSVFYFGDNLLSEHANFLFSEEPEKVGPNGRSQAGCYPPNAFGLYDMHGNVCEWTSSTHASGRIIRGGAWDYLPRLLRSSWWAAIAPETQRDNLGFRIAADVVAS